ncbi:kinase-like domain-containing protein, partial [Rhodocollybia butyracea]
QKWSGTMQHPSHRSKLGLMMTIFAHFSLEWTEKTLVFVDLQTSVINQAGKGQTNVLFDVMSHTITGDSGLGDFGQEGIQAFIDQHCCDKKCQELG